MTDIATLIGRLLPFAVIASLAMIFYLLDVFSVRPQFDAQPAKVAARQVTVSDVRRVDTPSVRRSDPFPAPTKNPVPPASDGAQPPPQATQGPAPVVPANNFKAEREAPREGEAIEPLPSPAAPMGGQDELSSAVPRYVPPAGSPGQPLATDTNTLAPVQLPNNEIPQDEGERVESETLQALDEAEQAASQSGAVEQEQ